MQAQQAVVGLFVALLGASEPTGRPLAVPVVIVVVAEAHKVQVDLVAVGHGVGAGQVAR